jgi:tRNA threonylcarbamoyladenosine biosynthesis protein TsaB
LNILLIDTASELLVVAAGNGALVHCTVTDAGRRHSTILMDEIDRALAHQGISPHELAGFICGTGPGSFTGLRIGLATMRMMAQVQNAPLAGISTPALFTWLYARPEETLVTALDAKKGKVFGGACRRTESGVISIVAPGDYYPESLADALRHEAHGGIVLFGDGIKTHGEAFAQELPNARAIPERSPDATALLAHYVTRFSSKREEYHWEKVLPDYARIADAEAALRASSRPPAGDDASA